MRRLSTIVLAGALLGGAGLAAPAGAALGPDAALSPGGLGPVRVGMTEREIERAAGIEVERDDYAGTGGACTIASLGGRDYLLFRRAKLARITIDSRRYATRGGIRVGDRQRKVRRQHGGKVRRSPHAYTRGAYLDVGRRSPRLRYEVSGRGRVTVIHAGIAPEIGYVEACA
ncbi:MAG TPA: hypothetical protein VIL49_16355 [Capillimicrobium sp.]|jgi:hypothetical protein